MRRKVVKVGASLCILLPKEVIKTMDWDFGDEIELILDEEDEKVTLRNPKEGEMKKQTYIEDFDDFLNKYKDVLAEIDSQEEVSD